MKILHSYCLNYNIGDYALGIGVKNLLRKYLSVDLIGNTNLQGREFNEYFIKEVVNKRYDLLVIGGGGVIHGAHWPNGWFWLIDKELIKEIKIPFIIYGVGYNYWKEEGGIPEKGSIHLKETYKYASYFSVRNDGSADRLLKDTGIQADIIPDPGFHVDLNTAYNNSVREPYVIIQIANDKPINRFGTIEKQKIFIQNMRDVTKQLSKEFKVIYSPHVIDDVQISKEIIKGIPNTEVWDFGYFAFDHSEKAVGYYKYAEFVIAMRGHGQILQIGFNTPVIALENHPKHRGLMEELDLLDYNVKVDDPDFLQNLIEKINLLKVKKKELRKYYQSINKDLEQSSKKAFDKIIHSI